MKKVLLTLIMSITLFGSLFAQHPETHWPDFYPGPWEDYVIITAFIQIDSSFIDEEDNWANMEIASFCGDECRGTAFMTYEGDLYPIVALQFWFNSDSATSEVASFKLYNHSTGMEYDISTCNYQITGGDSNYIQIYLSNYDEAVVINFITPTTTQTIELAGGTTWVSFNVDITLDDLKAAIQAALPSGNSSTATIMSKQLAVKYQRGRWAGQLNALDMTQMYMITVSSACEIVLEGMPVDPTTITIVPGANWIAYPFTTSSTPTTVFAGFAINDDVVRSKTQSAKYNRNRWAGQLTALEPNQGYIYISADNADRTFTYPTTISSKATRNVITGKAKAKMLRTTERTK